MTLARQIEALERAVEATVRPVEGRKVVICCAGRDGLVSSPSGNPERISIEEFKARHRDDDIVMVHLVAPEDA